MEFLEMNLVMDMGWILTFASKKNKTAQISIFRNDTSKTLDNSAIFLSNEVSDIYKYFKTAKEKQLEIIYPITNESWGVRRFFVKDSNGLTINLLSNLDL